MNVCFGQQNDFESGNFIQFSLLKICSSSPFVLILRNIDKKIKQTLRETHSSSLYTPCLSLPFSIFLFHKSYCSSLKMFFRGTWNSSVWLGFGTEWVGVVCGSAGWGLWLPSSCTDHPTSSPKPASDAQYHVSSSPFPVRYIMTSCHPLKSVFAVYCILFKWELI